MNAIGIAILVGFSSALLGLIIGSILQKRLGSSESRVRELKAALETEAENQNRYKQHVASHFSETATLLNELTGKYKDIHQHLALGADQLCRDEQGQSLLAGAAIELSRQGQAALSAQNEATEAAPQAPLDYAPKSESDSGTLSEDYGLEKINLHGDALNDADISESFEDAQDDKSSTASAADNNASPYTSAV